MIPALRPSAGPRRWPVPLLTLLALATLTGCDESTTPPPPAVDLPPEWTPDLRQPLDELRELAATTEQQQALNRTVANIGYLLDARLYFAFRQHLDTLPAPRRPAAVATQRAWLEKRRAATEAAGKPYTGGSLRILMAGETFNRLTEQRLAQLEAPAPQAR